MAVIGNLIIGIEATTTGLKKGIKESEGLISGAAKTLGTLGATAGKVAVGGLAAAAVGTAAVAATLPKLISMGSDAEEMMGKFNVVFGEFAQGTITDLDAMANRMGRSKFEMREFASSFQDTFVPMGFARGEAAKLSKQLVELTYDVASFNNEQESDVARAFQSALVGNTETVRQFGIVITQATLDQELLNMGVEGGVKAATEAEKVQARLNLIMAGTTDAQGDAERTSESWANQMRALKAVISDTGKIIGLELLPVFTPMLSRFRELAQEWGPKVAAVLTEKVIPAVSNIIKQIDAFAGSILEVFKENGLLGVGEYLAGEFSLLWENHIGPELNSWGGKLWDWLADPETGAVFMAADKLSLIVTEFDSWIAENEGGVANLGDRIGILIGDAIKSIFDDNDRNDSTMTVLIMNIADSVGRLAADFNKIGSDIAAHIINGMIKSFTGFNLPPEMMTILSLVAGGPVGLGLRAAPSIRGLLGFADGGIVPGPIGAPQMAVVHGGEMVLPAGSWNTRHTFEFSGGDARMRAVAEDTILGIFDQYREMARK